MTTKKQVKRGLLISVIGLILMVLGVLWLAFIFPALDKVPTDYAKTFYFDGTFLISSAQGNFTIPITQELAQEATGTEDGALLIHEVRTVKNAVTGQPLPAEYQDESTLAIDRHTLEFVPEVDERGRTGQWGPPRPLGEGDSFELWNPGASKPLTANYLRSEDFRDLGVVVFEINQDYIDIPENPQMGMDLYFKTRITLWIEPSSGTVVNQTSETTTAIDMMGMKIPVQISNVNYAEQTIEDLMDTAKSAHWSLLWFRTVVPWVFIGVGAFMVIIDTVLSSRRKGTQAR